MSVPLSDDLNVNNNKKITMGIYSSIEKQCICKTYSFVANSLACAREIIASNRDVRFQKITSD